MLFRGDGLPPCAASGIRIAQPSRSAATSAGRMHEAWRSMRQRGSEVDLGSVLAQPLIAWDHSSILVPPTPWDNFALEVISAALGCLMLIFLHRQKRDVAELRRNEKQLEAQKA